MTKQLVKEKEDAVAEAVAAAEQDKRESLLMISQFLRLAAQRRADKNTDPESDESLALEALLFLFYDGEDGAVQGMLKYIQGADENVITSLGDSLQTTCEFPSTTITTMSLIIFRCTDQGCISCICSSTSCH